MKKHAMMFKPKAGFKGIDPACLKPPKRLGANPELLTPGPPPSCPLALGGARGVPIGIDGPVDCTERYSSVLRCGGATLFFRRAEARRGPTIHHDYWWTVLRVAAEGAAAASSSSAFGPSSISLPAMLNLSHNTAFACAADGQTILAYGGRRKFLRFRDIDLKERGIHLSVGKVIRRSGGGGGGEGGAAARIEWSTPQLLHTGAASTGCIEKRTRVGPDCEFDGKLSVTHWHGRTYLYARANVAECGGRHVQMISAPGDGLATVGKWSMWRPIRFESGVSLGASSSNVYYFAVRPLGRWSAGSSSAAAAAAAADGGGGGGGGG